MATKTFAISKDSIVAVRGIDGASFGAGKDYHNYVGDSGDYTIRSLLQFTLDFTNVASINSATLYLKTPRSSDGTVNGVLRDTHGTWNSGSIKFSRVTSTWTEGTYGTDEGFNGVNSVEWDNKPTTTTTGAVNFTTRASRPSSPSNDTIVITDIVKAWAPLTVTGGGNATNYGIEIKNNTEGGSDYCEWYSLEGGASGISGAAAPYIVIDYNPAVPTVSIGGASTPASAGIARVINLNDTTEWSASTQLARPRLGWNYASAAGLTQGAWRVRIYSASTGGTTYYDSGLVTDAAKKTATFFDIPTNAGAETWLTSAAGYTGWSAITGLVNGTEYWWTIEVQDSSGQTSSESARYAFKVRWGQVIHSWDSGSPDSSQWDIDFPASPGATQSVVLYRSTTSTTATTGTWHTSISAVDSGKRYLQTMLRLSSDAGAQPSTSDITFSYLGTAVSPDNWEVDANGTLILDNGTYRFGTKSGYLSADTDAATYIQPKRNTYEWDVSVIPGNNYIFSAYVQPSPETLLTSRTIKLRVYEASGTSAALGTEIGSGSDDYTSFTEQDGWYRLTYQFNHGGNWVKPIIELGAGGAALDAMHIDGAQIEEGNVVRSWTPGFVTQAITMEGSGIAIDKQGGGSLRLRGSDTTGTRNIIELGANGLDFGGSINPAKIYGGAEYQLTLSGHLRSLSGTTTSGAFYSSIESDTVDRFAILADGKQEWGAGGSAARDTNLYRGGAGILKTDDALWIAGHTYGTIADGTVYDKAGAADSTVITTALSYNALTSSTNPSGFIDVTFTPQFVGQRWLMTFTGYASLNTTTIQYVFIRCSITDSSANIITSPTNYTSWAFTRAENFGTSSRGMAVGITKVWVADTTSTRKFKLYATTQTTNGLTFSMSYGQMHAIPLG